MSMLPLDISKLLLATTPWLLLGAALGIANLITLRWNLALLVAPRSLARALSLQLLRVLIVLAALAFAAVNGAAALLATGGALLLVRLALLRSLAPRGGEA